MKTILLKCGKEVKISMDIAKKISNELINTGSRGVSYYCDSDNNLIIAINKDDVSAIY